MDVKVDEDFLDNGNPDIELVKPFLYDPSGRAYYGMDNQLGKAFSIGKDICKTLKPERFGALGHRVFGAPKAELSSVQN